jgi:hypothetical protein
VHGQRVLAQRLSDLRCLDRPTPEREHGRALALERRQRRLGLEQPELDLAALLEQLRNRLPHRTLELAIEIDQSPPEPLGDLDTQDAFAGAHEPDERDVPV